MTLTVGQALDLPFKEACDFFRQKARVPTDHWTGVWRTAHSHSFMVAGATSDELLKDFQDAIQKALDKGTTLAEFRKDFDTIVEKHGWSHNGSPGWRSRIIYETNLSTAYHAGRYAQLTEPDTLAVYPYWTYVHSGSNHPRLQHLAWDGITLRANDPWFDTHFCPNGWHCGCRIMPVSERGLRRMGKVRPDTAPPLNTHPWRNPRTGEVHQIPAGIDPGFDYNPGKAWAEGGNKIPVRAPRLLCEPVTGAPPLATPAEMRRFGRSPQGEITVGQLAPEVQQLLGAEGDGVRLSAETMEKQRVRHPDLAPDDYLFLPTLLSQPEAVMEKGERRLLLLKMEEKTLAAVIKVTEDKKTYVVSFHGVRKKSVRAYERSLKLLLGTLGRILGE